MPAWVQFALGLLGGVVLLWVLLIVLLSVALRRQHGGIEVKELLRLAPDVVRLLGRLAADRSVAVRTRIWLGVLLLYLLSPIDLIPDFVPVLGYADDALIVAVALRSAIRAAGYGVVARHWPGSAAGLDALIRLVGLRGPHGRAGDSQAGGDPGRAA